MNARSLSKRSLAVFLTTILLLVAIPVSAVFADTLGPNYPGTASTGGGTGAAWTVSSGTLAGALGADGGTAATVTITDTNNGAEDLLMSNFGFSIPSNATIDGIQVQMNRWKSSGSANIRDEDVQLLKGGNPVGDNKANTSLDWPTTSSSTANYGGTDDKWGTDWTPDDINSSDFGVLLDVDRSGGGGSTPTASVDYVRVTVTYTVPAKQDPTLSITNSPVTYNGNPQAATVVGSVPGTVSDVKYNTLTTVPTNAGSYDVTADFAPTDTTTYNNLNDASAGTFDIEPAQLTITGVTANDKAYDGTTATTLSGTPTLVGVIGDDDVQIDASGVSVNFEDPSIGTDKPVTVTGFALTGADAANYTVVQPTGLTANITGGVATVTGIIAEDKVYDGNTNVILDITGIGLSGVAPGDDVDVDTNSISAAFVDENAGNNKQVIVSGLSLTGADAGNYTLAPTVVTANILPKDLTIQVTAQNKVYDGTTAANVTIASDALPGDVVSFTYSAAFLSKDVGEDIAVEVTNISLGGADAGNYNLVDTSFVSSADITKRPLTVTANIQTKEVGDPDPVFTFTITGFAPGETSAVIDVQPTCTVSVAHTLPGTYPIVCSGGVDDNYSFNYVNSTLTVQPVGPTGPVFADVPSTYWAFSFIERLYNAGVTAGCQTSPDRLYCPDSTVTRAEMAVFLLKAKNGASYTPPAVGASTGFGDVPTDHWAAPWIKQLAADGITAGCGGGNYCPDAQVTRAEMAVFLLKSKHGKSFVPPAATGVFTDVPTGPSGHWAAAWIERLAAEGITAGCGGTNYCPDSSVTRAEMAVFLVRTFNLP